MREDDYREIYLHMDLGAAIFRVVLGEDGRIREAIIEDCNERYIDIAAENGAKRDEVLGRSYYDVVPNHDPRWDYYIYRAAILGKHIRGEFRNREYGYWTEFSGGPAGEENTCWMVFIDHTRFQNENARLLELSMIDQLTRVKNRNAYEDVLCAFRAAEVPVGVIVADVNGLKEINDTKGHEEGDRTIEKTAAFLCTITEKDLPYRTGGDEFVILLDDPTGEETAGALARIRAFTEISLSSGAKWIADSSGIEEAVAAADAEMYEQKREYYQRHERRHV